LIGNWWIDCGWKGFTASVLLQASFTVMSDVILKGEIFKTVTRSFGETQVSAEAGGTADTQKTKFCK
jgi:hypothetical protein